MTKYRSVVVLYNENQKLKDEVKFLRGEIRRLSIELANAKGIERPTKRELRKVWTPPWGNCSPSAPEVVTNSQGGAEVVFGNSELVPGTSFKCQSFQI